MKERLKQFLTYLGISQNKFEKNVGLPNGFINNSKGNITIKSMQKILAAYPKLNQNWLLTGDGEMIKPVSVAGSVTQSGATNMNISSMGSIKGGITNYTGLSNNELIAILEDRFQYVLRKEDEVQGIYKENRDLIRKAIQQSDEYYKLNDRATAYRDEIEQLKERIVVLEKENDYLKKLNDGK